MSEPDTVQVSFTATTPRAKSAQQEGSPSPVGAATAPSVASVTVRMETPSRPPIKFSVENILDPTKFTGTMQQQQQQAEKPRINNNLFHPYPFFHPHHPWLLPMNPLLPAHMQQHPHHHQLDVHSTSVESEDSLYDRSDLESGNTTHVQLFYQLFLGSCRALDNTV